MCEMRVSVQRLRDITSSFHSAAQSASRLVCVLRRRSPLPRDGRGDLEAPSMWRAQVSGAACLWGLLFGLRQVHPEG